MSTATEPRTQTLELHEIEHDTATQSREAIDAETVERYGELMRDGVKFDPIVVFFDGVRYWLADGWHRRGGAEWASKKSIDCLVHEGSKEEAELYAAGANARHGKAMNNADKRKAVGMVLRVQPDWSSRQIARHVGVSDMFVGKVRSEVQTVCTSTDGGSLADQFERRIGSDGKSYPATKPTQSIPDRPEEAGDDWEQPADDRVELFAMDYQESLNLLSAAASSLTVISTRVTESSDLLGELAEDPEQGAYVRDKVTRIRTDTQKLLGHVTQVSTDLQSMRAMVRGLEPVEVCPHCDASGCPTCRKTGFVTRGIQQARGPQS